MVKCSAKTWGAPISKLRKKRCITKGKIERTGDPTESVRREEGTEGGKGSGSKESAIRRDNARKSLKEKRENCLRISES